MSQTHGTLWPRIAATPRRRAWSALALLGLVVVLATPRPSEASPIRNRLQARPFRSQRVQRLQARPFRAQRLQAQRFGVQRFQARRAQIRAARVLASGSFWDRYFARALRAHRLKVRGPNALRVLSTTANTDGRLLDSAFVDYLLWRRSLNTARFDHYHPQLGPLLDHDAIVQVHTPEPGQITPPPPSFPPGNPNPEVPEPSSAAVALLLFAAGIWARRRNRSRRVV